MQYDYDYIIFPNLQFNFSPVKSLQLHGALHNYTEGNICLRPLNHSVYRENVVSFLQHRYCFRPRTIASHSRSFTLLYNAPHEIIPFNGKTQSRNFRMDGWSLLNRTGVSRNPGVHSISPGEKNGLLLFRTRCEQMHLAADLKNCILYSITRLSVRTAAFYNSKRIQVDIASSIDRSLLGSMFRDTTKQWRKKIQ